MARTLISDIIVPQIWLPYTVQQTAELSELITSGILDASTEWDTRAEAAGRVFDMPFWNDISGADEVLSDSTALTPGKMTTAQDRGVLLKRGRAWEHSDLVAYLSGSDPASALGQMVGGYWARRLQATTLSVLKGVFAAASMSGNLSAIHSTAGGAGAQTDANCLNANTFIDACQLLGDAKSSLSGIMMHSSVESSLRKLDLIDFMPASEQGKPIAIFQGHRVIVDDGMPTATVDGKTVFTTYIFGTGALAYGVGGMFDPVQGGFGTSGAEFYRDALGSASGMITRRRMVVHPRGVKWAEPTVAGSSPTNAEMEGSDAFVRVWEQKQIRIVKVTHNILA